MLFLFVMLRYEKRPVASTTDLWVDSGIMNMWPTPHDCFNLELRHHQMFI